MPSAPKPSKLRSVANPSVASPSVHAPAEATEKTSQAKIEEGIQEIVRSELLRAGLDIKVKIGPSTKLHKKDIAFLVVAVIDLVMLFWLIPSAFWKDERIAFVKDVFPILLASLCGFLATLYRDPLLKIAQNTGFRVLDIALAIVLVIIWAPLLPFLPIVEPDGARVTVDGEKEARELHKPLRVNFREHSYHLERSENSVKAITRTFTISGLELFAAIWRNQPLRWSLLYKVQISSDRSGTDLIIEREGSDFDHDFLHGDFLEQNYLTKHGDRIVNFQMMSDMTSGRTKLPVGTYKLGTTSAACTVPPTLTIDPGENDKIEFVVDISCQPNIKRDGS